MASDSSRVGVALVPAESEGCSTTSPFTLVSPLLRVEFFHSALEKD